MTNREKLIDLMCQAKKADTEDGPFSEFLADFLLANGVTFLEWHNVAEEKPDDFVSVLGHMTDAGDFPAVRECYFVGGGKDTWFPALFEFHSVDKWAYMPEVSNG